MGSKVRTIVILLILAVAGVGAYYYWQESKKPTTPLTQANVLYAKGKLAESVKAYRHALARDAVADTGVNEDMDPDQIHTAYKQIMLAEWEQAKLGFDDKAQCKAAVKACEEYLAKYASRDAEQTSKIQGRISKLKGFLQ